MLSQQDNEILTRVGPGTLMGALLRRYWTPACLAEEVAQPGGAPLRVRLLGENLVAFRDTDGKLGLVGEHCPHRGVSLFYGRNEGCGLRCLYHGWQFDVDGNCVDMPTESAERSFKDRIKLTSYPVHESGGLVWAYLGPPETITPFRDFGTESLSADDIYVTKQHTTSNWVQVIEGNLDSAHISHLHQFEAVEDIPDDGADQPGYPPNALSWKFWRHDRAPRIEMTDTWYGFRYAAIRTTPKGHTHVRISAFIPPYSTVVASIPFTADQWICVPIDDHNSWKYTLRAQPIRNPRCFGGGSVFDVAPFTTPFMSASGGILPRDYTAENDYKIDREVQRTSTFSGIGDFLSQDLMATESMGAIQDRTQEHLGTTDVAIGRMRHLLMTAARGLGDGAQPPALGGQDYERIWGAEKILEPGEDWRVLGTEDDPVVQEAFSVHPGTWSSS